MFNKTLHVAVFVGIILGLNMGMNNYVHAQDNSNKSDVKRHKPDPKIAFLKSLVLPGWGHYYVNKHHWTRGKYHMAADALLIISYLGLRSYSDHLKNDMFTYAQTYSGTDIRNRERSYQLNVGEFDSRTEYNNFQERARNWDQLYPDTPKYYWQWKSDQNRLHYLSMKNSYDRTHEQLPTLITLMVANRIISGISAYLRARKKDAKIPQMSLSMPVYKTNGQHGIMANLIFSL
ncbi:MAG TPA: hypothetical protein VKA34_00815 [Balneolales bacterium]|nr:hypothetical protein [Balneolales bacterium]